MSSKITLDDCRSILNGERDDEVLGIYVETVADLSEEDKFNVAEQLILEIETYNAQIPDSERFEPNRIKIYSSLIASFESYDGISRESFAKIITREDVYAIAVQLIKNKAFPVDFLLNTSLFQKFKDNSFGKVFNRYIESVKFLRYPEIISYYRGLVPDSEHMSDEMVLSVAGVYL